MAIHRRSLDGQSYHGVCGYYDRAVFLGIGGHLRTIPGWPKLLKVTYCVCGYFDGAVNPKVTIMVYFDRVSIGYSCDKWPSMDDPRMAKVTIVYVDT